MKLEKEDDQIFDYDSKYISDDIIKETFPEIVPELKNKLTDQSLLAYNYFQVKTMARIEFIVKNNELYFLEVNTIPGLTEASILPKAWEKSGKSFEELVESILK